MPHAIWAVVGAVQPDLEAGGRAPKGIRLSPRRVVYLFPRLGDDSQCPVGILHSWVLKYLGYTLDASNISSLSRRAVSTRKCNGDHTRPGRQFKSRL